MKSEEVNIGKFLEAFFAFLKTVQIMFRNQVLPKTGHLLFRRRQLYLALGLTSGYGIRFGDESLQTSADGVAEGVWHAHRSGSTGWRVARVGLLNAPNCGCYKTNIKAFYLCMRLLQWVSFRFNYVGYWTWIVTIVITWNTIFWTKVTLRKLCLNS